MYTEDVEHVTRQVRDPARLSRIGKHQYKYELCCPRCLKYMPDPKVGDTVECPSCQLVITVKPGNLTIRQRDGSMPVGELSSRRGCAGLLLLLFVPIGVLLSRL